MSCGFLLIKAQASESTYGVLCRGHTHFLIVGGTPIEKLTKSNRLSADMKTMLSKAKRGQKVYIEGIKARGPDGTVRSIGSLAFKVT